MRLTRALTSFGAVVIGCAPLGPVAKVEVGERVALVVAEKGPGGARLVAIDERGDRRAELVKAATGVVRDTHPVVSPDDRWLVFASSRGRSLDETSLWIARLGVGEQARRLTTGPGIDAHPTWTPDGKAIVFASTRAAGNFDLWRLELRDGVGGALTRLTDGPGHEVTPAVARDGSVIYAEVTQVGEGREVESHLERRASDGTVTRISDGPADSSPALSPDGARLVFARPQLHGGKLDGELWLSVSGGPAKPLVDLPLTDESGPVWSRDGRFVLATSVLRGEGARVIWSSVIHVDTREAPTVARVLEDRVGAQVRMTPAVTSVALDAAALRRNPAYLAELARTMARVIEEAQRRAAEPVK
jgi:Tol biopolymer transport system component